MTIACASKMMMILILLVLVSKFIDQDKMVNNVSKYSDVLGMAKDMITMHLNEGKFSVLLYASCLKAVQISRHFKRDFLRHRDPSVPHRRRHTLSHRLDRGVSSD